MMNQESELQAVKRKIRALLAKTRDNGATESEASMAMGKVGELLEQYNLSMDEVTLRQESCIKGEFVLNSVQKNAAFSTLMAIGVLCQVTVWHSRKSWGEKKITLCMFGLEQDVELAKYLAELIQESEMTSVESFKKSATYAAFVGHRKSATSNFKKGFASRINERLHNIARDNAEKERQAAAHMAEQMQERMIGQSDAARAETARQTTGTQLISLAKSRFVDEEFKKLGMKLRTVISYDRSRYDPQSRSAGHAAANNVNLSRPIANSGGGSSVLQIGSR
jgi:hypothetical protein